MSSDDAIQFGVSTQFEESTHSKEPARWRKELSAALRALLVRRI